LGVRIQSHSFVGELDLTIAKRRRGFGVKIRMSSMFVVETKATGGESKSLT
jgi:hypothetical protein